jgi:signal transduction histidine kinase
MSPQAVFVPLVVHDQTIGVLGAGRRKEFADADTSLLAALADIAANAIRRATLHDQTRQRAEQLAAINTLSHALAEILSLPQIYEQLHQAILQLLPASTAIYISLRNATTNVSQCVYAAHGSNLVEPAIGAAEFAFDQLEIGQGEAIRLRQPVALNDLGAPGGVLKSGLFAPMMVKGQVVGVIHVQTDSPDHYNEGETEILSLMANTAAIAIENATLVSELQGSIEELQTAQGRLIQSARLSAVGELAAGVAHQINNPLTTIIADAQLLTRSINNDHPGAASAAAIYQAGWRAQRVVKQLLNFARPDQGELKATNLNETIQEAMELVGAHMGRGGAKVEIELGKNIPLILANGHQLQEVWLNLLMNAHDALLPDRPGLIRLETSLDADKQSVIVTIADNGRGIAESDGSNLFTLFFTTKGEGRGNGLGLSVCQRIVRSHGGEISFQSQVGQGTTFVVTLPLKPLP